MGNLTSGCVPRTKLSPNKGVEKMRKPSDLHAFENEWGRCQIKTCEEILIQLAQLKSIPEAIAVLDLARARLNLLASVDESTIRQLQEAFLNPVRVHLSPANIANPIGRETKAV